ncbi:hypothetical protein EYC84_011999 [Monilinia fructicola]|uniref:Exoribonuclease phosphorolytic domain-containing protein n=1 Tax=Monilinia fructicola TaxID=38448 RepID=A0A5M9J4X3_MONFR|nr:hypothetical protein EYC84_011999 [Monilinia fructicola]
MPRELEPSINEKQFFSKALQENLRIDGRSFDQFRALELEFGDEYGVADVRLGKTRVLVNITAEVTSPFPDRLFDGIFTITTELSPMASPAFETNRPTEQEKCWSVRADVHILSHDGNLIDASCIAIIAALQHFRKPDTSTEGETVTVYTLAEREPVPLSLLHFPLCVTFSFYGKSMNRHGEVCQIAKLGGIAVDALELLQCSNIALEKVKDMTAYITKRLQEDLKKRDKGGLMAELRADNSSLPARHANSKSKANQFQSPLPMPMLYEVHQGIGYSNSSRNRSERHPLMQIRILNAKRQYNTTIKSNMFISFFQFSYVLYKSFLVSLQTG